MKRLIYVVGTGFSGSTLFSFLLNGHPEIATVGEATGPLDTLQVTGKPVFLDASKDPVRAGYPLRHFAAEVRLMHQVRDAPGFVSSFVKNEGYSVGVGIRSWNRMAAHGSRPQAIIPPRRFLRVQYGELCTETSHVLDRVARFAGVAPFPEPIKFRDCTHHIIGNRILMGSSKEIILDESWRDRLTA